MEKKSGVTNKSLRHILLDTISDFGTKGMLILILIVRRNKPMNKSLGYVPPNTISEPRES